MLCDWNSMDLAILSLRANRDLKITVFGVEVQVNYPTTRTRKHGYRQLFTPEKRLGYRVM